MLERTQSYRVALAALESLRAQVGNTEEVRAIAQYLFDSAIAVYPSEIYVQAIPAELMDDSDDIALV